MCTFSNNKNSNNHSYCVSYEPGTVLGTWHILTPLQDEEKEAMQV